MVKEITPMKAIRQHCLSCSGGSPKEVADCIIKDCSLYPYRFGRRPQTIKKKEEQKAKNTLTTIRFKRNQEDKE